ncbi:MAG: hypothetical protein J5J00_13070 [Deltaproteobacteria bacterium]|nr:hypothetical protein [Deltaproteobacteria bacterium]
MYEKFDTLVIEPDMSARIRIKTATTAVPTFGKVVQVNNIDEGREKIKSERLDVIFVSCIFSQEETAKFIQETKSTVNGQDAAFVLVLKTQEKEASSVAQNVLVGADGLLFEPYSVDSLVEITRLAAQVKKERAQTREMAAIKVILNDIMEQLNLVAYLKKMKIETGRHAKKLKEMTHIFDSFDETKKAIYKELVLDAFINAPIPTPPKNLPTYSGVSSRIKKRIEEKIAAKLGES